MAVDERIMFPERGSPLPGCIHLAGTIVIGAAGAITSQTGTRFGMVTFAKNAAAGRYDATINRNYKRFVKAGASVIQATVGAVPAIADGANVQWTGISAAMVADPPTAALPSTGLSLQCTRTDTGAAANPASTNIISWWLEVTDQ